MRIPFANAVRPKSAAKLISRHSKTTPLSKAQNAVARATGYRDWHDLGASLKVEAGEASIEISDARDIILAVSGELGVDEGLVQYALSKSRVLGTLSLEQSLDLRAMIWRASLFGVPARGKAGTVVKVKGFKKPAYLKSMGGLSRVIWSDGFGTCVDEEIVTPRVALEDFVPQRLWLPYGLWTTKGGARVLFSRDYKPMWIITGNAVEPMKPWIWVDDIEDEKHFFMLARDSDWDSSKAVRLSEQYLLENRIFELPPLVDAMRYLLEPEVDTFNAAVRRMKAERSPCI